MKLKLIINSAPQEIPLKFLDTGSNSTRREGGGREIRNIK
jgi:hypothetical protein